MKNKSTR